LIVDELNHSFDTSTQVKFTHIGPSENTDAIYKLSFTNLSKFYAFVTNHSERNTHTNQRIRFWNSCGRDDIPVHPLKLSKCLLAPLLSNVITNAHLTMSFWTS